MAVDAATELDLDSDVAVSDRSQYSEQLLGTVATLELRCVLRHFIVFQLRLIL
jgi:hypothetical protein